MATPLSARALAAVRALEYFSYHLRQDVLIECQIGDHALQLRVLIPQPSQFLDLREPQVPVALPEVEARLAAPELAASFPVTICSFSVRAALVPSGDASGYG
jgi:hypothetical protein